MLNAAAIVAFVAFAATADAEASRMFYGDILKLRLVSDEPYALVFDANGTTLRIQKVQNVMPVPYTTLGWNVEDIVALHDILATAGVAFERFPNFGQDSNGIVEFPGGAKVAWFKDPDGNLLSLTQTR